MSDKIKQPVKPLYYQPSLERPQMCAPLEHAGPATHWPSQPEAPTHPSSLHASSPSSTAPAQWPTQAQHPPHMD